MTMLRVYLFSVFTGEAPTTSATTEKGDGIEIMTTAKTLATIQVSVKTNFLSFAYLFCCISTSVLPLLIFFHFKCSDVGSVLDVKSGIPPTFFPSLCMGAAI